MSKESNSNAPALIAQDLLDFIDESPTPFHATANLVAMFREAGYTVLDEGDDWKCKPGGNFVTTRNDSSIIAFSLADDLSGGMRMIGAHTDSPCLRIKPNPELEQDGYNQLGIEVYGGALLHPWLDRDLSIAGRVSGVDQEGELYSQLIDFGAPVAIAPNLAIHLDRRANREKTINPQTNLPLIIGQGKERDFKELLLDYCDESMAKILDFELSCYDTQAPSFVGLNQEFIAAARLDNLLSSYIGARALIDGGTNSNAFYISTDHEEVGSASACGAQGPFLRSVLERLCNDSTKLTQVISRSTMISCDNAHGVHPNYDHKHDQNHGPLLNHGPVIKINAKQRYASNSISSARFQRLCEKADVPVQHFVTRADMGCGSTIGPIVATELGVETLDIGAPQWAMHSIRETAGSKDVEYLHIALMAYLNND
ncbi:MAG: M18 family aminopeptidase [Pseudomonadota bacterium]